MMRTDIRRVLAMLLAMMLVISLIGCGSSSVSSYGITDNEAENQMSTDDGNEAEQQKTGAAAEETDENSASDENLSSDEDTAAVGNYLDNLGLEIWDGSVAESYAGGSGTEEDPYQISNGAELALMAQEINEGIHESCYYILTADIQLNDLTDWENWLETPPANTFTSIGDDRYSVKCKCFKGVFDGQYHTIYGYYSSNGLFKCLEFGGTIKNLSLYASVVNSDDKTYTDVGGIVDEILKSNNFEENEILIQSCSFHGIVQGSGSAGGIVGSAALGAGISVKMCKNIADIIGSYDTGGIIGDLSVDSGGGEAFIYGCENYGNVTSSTDDAGGIIGVADVQNGAEGSIYVFSCRNTGTVTSMDYSSEGGIVGDIGVGAGESITIQGCVNSAGNGIIDDFGIGANGTLALVDNYYTSRYSAYDTQLKALGTYGTFYENHLVSMDLADFRAFGLPIYSDAQEALDTGDYVEYNGKIYYQGYSGELFRANPDGTQEERLATSISGTNYATHDNCMYYYASDENYNSYIASYNMDTGKETYILEADGATGLSVQDGVLYYALRRANQIVKYKLSDGTEEIVDLENVNGVVSFFTIEDWIIVTYRDDWTIEEHIIYNFYTMDGKLTHEVDPYQFGEDVVMALSDLSLLVYVDDKILIYDPISEEITTEIAFTDAIITYFWSMDDEYIYAEDYDLNYYKISRADGSSKKY